jgi:hypothetical protein
MLDNLGQLEQRARHLYAPTMTSQSNGRTFVQCELDDEMAEARARMRARLAPLAQAVFYFVSRLVLIARTWRMAQANGQSNGGRAET